MKAQVQVALTGAAVLFLGGGLALLFTPGAAAALLSSAPVAPAMTAMFGSALFAFATLFIIAARAPVREVVYGSAVSLGLLGLVAGYQLLIAKHMPQNPASVITLVLTLGIGVFLFISLTDAAMELAKGGRAKRRSPPRRKTKKARRRRR